MPATKTRRQLAIEDRTGLPIERAMEWALQAGRSRLAAAELLGIERHTLALWLDDYGLDADRIIAQAILDEVA